MIELESMAVEMPEVEGHPNRAPFRGVLTVVDVASQRAPSGSKGRRVVLTRAAAEAALPSLLGMALDYAPAFDRHDQRRKVGVITSAEVVGRNLEVSGYLYAKDFPEIVEEIARATARGQGSGARDQGLGVRGQENRSGDSVPTLAANGTARMGHSLRVALATAAEGIRELTRSIRGGAKTPTLRQAQGRLSRAKSGREMGHPAGTVRAEIPTPSTRSARSGQALSHKPRQGWGNRNIPSLVAQGAREMEHPAAGIPRSRKNGETWGTPSIPGELGMSFEVADVTVMDMRAHVWILTHVVFTGAAILRRDKAAYEDTWIELV